jgi:hypothetical protein
VPLPPDFRIEAVMDTIDTIAFERPRRRPALPIVAVIVPVALAAGGAALFFWSAGTQPMPSLSEPPLQVDVAQPAGPESDPSSVGSIDQSQTPARSALVQSNDSIWPPVVMPGNATQDAAPAPMARVASVEPGRFALGEPIAGPIPLPPRRPRIASPIVRGPVPLPRSRPN